MKKLILKQVPEVEVQQWFLKMNREPPPLVVPKVIRQYTRKKKNLQSESVSKPVAPNFSSSSATLSDQSHPEATDNSVKINDDDANEIKFLNVDIKEEPNSPYAEEIKEEIVSEDTNIDKNSTVFGHVKKENYSENQINKDIIPGKNCLYNEMTAQVKIKEEIVDIVIEDIGVNHKNKMGQPSVMSNAMSLQAESSKTKADAEMGISTSVESINVQNEEIMMNETLHSGGTLIKKEIKSEVTDAKLTPVINEIMKKPSEGTKLRKITLKQLKQFKGREQIITSKKYFCVPFKITPGSSVIRMKRHKLVALPPRARGTPKVPRNFEAEGMYACDACGKHYDTKGGVRRHVTLAHSAAACHACPECAARFPYYFELLAHLRQHSGKPFACDLCPKRFKRRPTYANHLNTHLRERLVSCPVCLRRFAGRAELARHAARHSRADTFPCDSCDARFPAALPLRRHREAAHGERLPHPCYVCSRALATRLDLVDHFRDHAGADLECAFCPRRFTDLREWEEHAGEHVATPSDGTAPYLPRPHVCRVCDKSFAYRSTMETHLAAHTGRRPFECGECSRSYKTRSALAEHERGHARPFSCDTCGERFAKRHTLARHTMTHTGERPHACAHCEAAFAQRPALLQHVRRHHMPSLKRARNKRKTKTGRKSDA